MSRIIPLISSSLFRQTKSQRTLATQLAERLALDSSIHFPPPVSLIAHEKHYQCWGRLLFTS